MCRKIVEQSEKRNANKWDTATHHSQGVSQRVSEAKEKAATRTPRRQRQRFLLLTA